MKVKNETSLHAAHMKKQGLKVCQICLIATDGKIRLQERMVRVRHEVARLLPRSNKECISEE
jgi:hypothetical protein